MAEEPKKSDTKNPLAKELYSKAGTLFEDNKFDEAIEIYSQALKIDPLYSSAYFNRALSYAILNRYEDATRDIETVLKNEPDSYDAPYVMGIINEYQHDYDGAKEWYEKALKKNSDSTITLDTEVFKSALGYDNNYHTIVVDGKHFNAAAAKKA